MNWKPIQTRLGVTADGDAGPKTWAALLARVGAVGNPLQLQIGAAFVKYASDGGLTTPLRIAHCLAQSSVETAGFTQLTENLNYRAETIVRTWPSRFPTVASATPFAHNPEALANKVYGGRFGNVRPGDGWFYRGRGTKQTTFHDNYAEVERVTGLPVLATPDLLGEADAGTRAGCIYWHERNCNALADADDIGAVTRRVNGGLNGLPERRAALARAKAVLL